MKNYDVIIIGAGTAGIMLARELGKFKKYALVLDRKDNLLEFSFNTLGSFINLDKFNLSDGVVAQEIDSIVLHSRSLKKVIKPEKLYVLDKKKVHQEIIHSFDTKYITVKTGVHIKNILKDDAGNFTSVIDENKEEYFGKIIVDASGTNAIISKKVGLQSQKTQLATGVEYNVKYLGKTNQIHLMSGKMYQGGYGWIFPLKDDRAIIGFGTFKNEVVKKLKQQLHTILELPKIKKLVEKDNDKVEGGSIPITPVLEKFVQHNLVCVGDSVSQVNPIVGEGYKFIFEAAVMASKAINTALEKDDVSLLKSYELEWKKRFSANYKRSKIAQERVFKYTSNETVTDLVFFLALSEVADFKTTILKKPFKIYKF